MYMSVSESKAQPGHPWAHVSWPRGPQAKQHFRPSPTLVSLTSELNSLALRARAPEPLGRSYLLQGPYMAHTCLFTLRPLCCFEQEPLTFVPSVEERLGSECPRGTALLCSS